MPWGKTIADISSVAVFVRATGKGSKRWANAQDTKYENVATLSKRKSCNFLTCSRLDQAVPYNNSRTLHKISFHASERRHTKSAKTMWLMGEDKRSRFSGTTLFKTKGVRNCVPCLRQRTLEMIPSRAEGPYIGNIWEYPTPGLLVIGESSGTFDWTTFSRLCTFTHCAE